MYASGLHYDAASNYLEMNLLVLKDRFSCKSRIIVSIAPKNVDGQTTVYITQTICTHTHM